MLIIKKINININKINFWFNNVNKNIDLIKLNITNIYLQLIFQKVVCSLLLILQPSL